MKIVIAPDSFTEFKSAKKIADIIKKEILKHIKAEIKTIPMADGGKGTSEALLDAIGGKTINIKVLDPLGRKIKSSYIVLKKKTAFIEMAKASGIELVKKIKNNKFIDQRNPFLTSTYGTGQLIKHAMNKGVKKIILGVGGSATNDGGIGSIQALGAKFYDNKGEIKERKKIGYSNITLKSIKKIDTSKLKKIKIFIACDVNNPLLGKNGASYVYGPQKGASKKDIKQLDNNLKYYADVVEKKIKRKIRNTRGIGAAGGLPYSLVAFLNAKLQRGVDIIAEQVKLKEHVKNADVVITGEGKIDKQSFMGKVIQGVAETTKKVNKKAIIIAIGGCVINNYNKNKAKKYFNIITDSSKGKKPSKKQILKYGVNNLRNAAKEALKYIEKFKYI